MAAGKLDLYKEHKSEYVAPKKPGLVRVKPALYLAIEGRGEPGGKEFTDGIGALYGVAYTVKMARKAAGRDYKVCGLEALWFSDGGAAALFQQPRGEWRWKLLIRTPDFIRHKDLEAAVKTLLKKGKTELVRQVKLEMINEGQCVQMLHVGPYANEVQTIAQMEAFAAASGLAFAGSHHEIYISDPRRVAAARLKTILRHAVR